MATPAYDRPAMPESSIDAVSAELLAELERLRRLEERLKSEHRQLRAAAETETARLHAALRETADRVREREREIERLTRELEARRAPEARDERTAPPVEANAPEQAIAPLLARLEQDRRVLDQRARAVAETEARQRETQAKLEEETRRLDELREALDAARREDLDERLHAEATRQKDEQLARTVVAVPQPAAAPVPVPLSKRERELVRREQELRRREVELALLRRRLVEAELRLSERAWRIGALGSGDAVPEDAGPGFAAGLRGMGRKPGPVAAD